MKERYVLVRIDDLAEMLKEYVGTEEDIPGDAMPIRLMLKPTEQGKLAIEFFSDSYTGKEAPLSVDFQIKRIFTV